MTNVLPYLVVQNISSEIPSVTIKHLHQCYELFLCYPLYIQGAYSHFEVHKNFR